jgi:hypothetical protein
VIQTSRVTTRRDIAAEVYTLGLCYALRWHPGHYQAQAVADVFGDVFTSWFTYPYEEATRTARDVAIRMAHSAREFLNKDRSSVIARHALSIATDTGKVVLGAAEMGIDRHLDVLKASDALRELASKNDERPGDIIALLDGGPLEWRRAIFNRFAAKAEVEVPRMLGIPKPTTPALSGYHWPRAPRAWRTSGGAR